MELVDNFLYNKMLFRSGLLSSVARTAFEMIKSGEANGFEGSSVM